MRCALEIYTISGGMAITTLWKTTFPQTPRRRGNTHCRAVIEFSKS
jgi:hypothetical protein